MTNTDHAIIIGDYQSPEWDKLSQAKLDANRNLWEGQLGEVPVGKEVEEEEDQREEREEEGTPGCPYYCAANLLTNMSTVRSYLQSKKQYLPTALLMICVTFYLPYSYVSVLHAREQHLNDLVLSSGFQKVANRSHVLFSAYLDDRFPRERAKVRILGFKSKKDEEPLYCKLYFQNHNAVCLSTPAIELRLDPKEQNTLETQCFFHCTLPEHLDQVPVAVTLTSSKKCEGNDHVVPVKLLQGNVNQKRDIAVCFATPSGEISGENKRRELIETLELSRLFGASVVQMYNESMDPNLRKLLEPYIKSGFLSLLSWNPGDRYLPSTAKVLSMNDCVYRNVAKFKNIVFVDKDRIILPSPGYNSSWKNLIAKMKESFPSAGAFWFDEVVYTSEEGLFKGRKAKPLPANCSLSQLPSSQLPRIFTHRFSSKLDSNQVKNSQVILDPSVVLYVDSDMRISFLPGKNSNHLATEVGQSVHFVDHKKLKESPAMETFRSNYNVQLTNAIYNRLGYTKRLDLSNCHLS